MAAILIVNSRYRNGRAGPDVDGQRRSKIAGKASFVYYSCMATKTITLELDAYEKLKRAKRAPRESFSSVVRRGRWDESTEAGTVLDALRDLHRRHPESFLEEEALDRMDERISSRERRFRPASAVE